MSKIGAIIQARMGSNRLPAKVSLDLQDKPLLGHIIERLRQSELIDQIVVATSDKKDDDRVAEIAKTSGVDFYRGSEQDVLSRYIEAAEKFNIDIIVRITGDCPLIDPLTVDEIIKDYLDSDVDYMGHQGYPRGLDTEVFSYPILLNAEKNIAVEEDKKDNPYREHVTYYLYTHPEKYSVKIHQAPSELKRGYRLCVDEEEDFKLIKNIYNELYKKNNIIDIKDVIDYLDNHPEIVAINNDVEQKNPTEEG